MAAWECSFERNRHRPAALIGIAEAMQRADAGIADPGKDELIGATHPDELIVNEIGRHPDERKMAAPLANDLVPSRERNEMREPFHRYGIAVAQGLFHGFGEAKEARHCGNFRYRRLCVR